MIIYLARLLPAASSDLPESRPGRPIALNLVLLRMGFTCAPPVTGRTVVSYTALPPLPRAKARGCIFLLHWPWSRLHRTLSGILPCEARTFLTRTRARSFILLILYRNLFKNTSSHKFPAQRILRKHFAADTQKIFQEFQKPFRLMIFRFSFLNAE